MLTIRSAYQALFQASVTGLFLVTPTWARLVLEVLAQGLHVTGVLDGVVVETVVLD
jgi:hypothetical protein